MSKRSRFQKRADFRYYMRVRQFGTATRPCEHTAIEAFRALQEQRRADENFWDEWASRPLSG